ncbi:OstA-like protein [Blattabacterium cuenoti]|uniref:OstA-like protein n=1 Tax=Blattabacterium cuenoti TaxID=1653831 RepID=UPI00163C05AC|nr:OstA-like protein [Blattabacterium cuenoti]
MNQKYYYFVFFLFLLILNNQGSNFQIANKTPIKKKVQLIHADFVQKKNDNIIYLIGHIHFEHNGSHLFCDKAIYYKKNNQFHGYGNVQLVSSKNRIFSKEIEYSGRFGFFKVSGNVIFIQKNIKLTASRINYNLRKKYFQAKNVILFFKKLKLSTNILEYDLQLKKVSYKKGGLISYGNFIKLYSREGSYFLKKGKAKFKDKIKFVNKNYTIFSNTIEYLFRLEKIDFFSPTIIVENNNTKSNNFLYAKEGSFFLKKGIFLFRKYFSIHYNGKIVKGEYLFFDHKKKYGFIKNIFFEDPKKKYFLIGETSNFDLNSGVFFLKKNTIIIKGIKNYKNSIFIIHSDTIKILFKKESNLLIIKAFPVNRFFLNGIFHHLQVEGKCHSLVYEQSTNNNSYFSSILLDGNPIFWINNNLQLTGDSISIHRKKDSINSLDIKNVFLRKKIDSKKFHQIQGDKMTVFFSEKNIKKVLIQGNIKSIIFLDKNIIQKSDCGMILLDLEKGKISCTEKTYSEIFPFSKNITDIEKKLFLPKFFWIKKDPQKMKKDFLLKQIEKYKKESFLEEKEIKKIKKYEFFYETIRVRE